MKYLGGSLYKTQRSIPGLCSLADNEVTRVFLGRAFNLESELKFLPLIGERFKVSHNFLGSHDSFSGNEKGEFQNLSSSMNLSNTFPKETITPVSAGILTENLWLKLLSCGLLMFCRLAYGFRAHVLNLGSYCLGLFPMTFLVVSIRPGMAFNSTGIINETSDHSEILDTKVSSIGFYIPTF